MCEEMAMAYFKVLNLCSCFEGLKRLKNILGFESWIYHMRKINEYFSSNANIH